ncbi:hypothetical protein ACVWXO_001023 [Bradyrhizobium sp. LM2.7]
MKAATYARFSSHMQTQRPIEDKVALGRANCEGELIVVAVLR